jgi:hypothetical protein
LKQKLDLWDALPVAQTLALTHFMDTRPSGSWLMIPVLVKAIHSPAYQPRVFRLCRSQSAGEVYGV